MAKLVEVNQEEKNHRIRMDEAIAIFRTAS